MSANTNSTVVYKRENEKFDPHFCPSNLIELGESFRTHYRAKLYVKNFVVFPHDQSFLSAYAILLIRSTSRCFTRIPNT